MTSFTLTEPLAHPAAAWDELVAHPELLWGHGAPDLEPGRDYASHSQAGTGGQGRIEAVRPGRVEFTWGGPGWERPGRFVVLVGDDLRVEAHAVPDAEAAAARAHWERMVRGAAEYLNHPNAGLDAPVRAVLFDADGVLQWPRPGWLADFVRIGGDDFMVDAFRAEVACLAGGDDLRPRLELLLAESGTGGSVDEILEVWHDIVIDAEALAVVERVRASGLIVGLATNQQSYRGGHMRHVYGIDRHFDHAFYSYEVGHAKPSPAFFGHIVAELGLPAEQVAFVDDAPANVRGARLAGLRAALHRVGDGASGLAADLAGLGVPI